MLARVLRREGVEVDRGPLDALHQRGVADQAGGASKSIVSSCPTSAFVEGGEDRLGELLGLLQARRERDAATAPPAW